MSASLQRGPLPGGCVTLRGRLTSAFLVVVLGPVLLGSIFVALTVAAVSRERTNERLDHAVTTVQAAVGAICGQLQAAADAVAVVPADSRPAVADPGGPGPARPHRGALGRRILGRRIPGSRIPGRCGPGRCGLRRCALGRRGAGRAHAADRAAGCGDVPGASGPGGLAGLR